MQNEGVVAGYHSTSQQRRSPQCEHDLDDTRSKQEILQLNFAAMSHLYKLKNELKRPTCVPGKWSRGPGPGSKPEPEPMLEIVAISISLHP